MYLERNAAIIAELQDRVPKPQPIELIGKGHTMSAYAVGSVEISDGQDMPVTVKTFTELDAGIIRNFPYRSREAMARFAQGLSYASLVDEHLPAYSHLLPRFMGLTVDEEGNPTGQVMEDFSDAKSRKVLDYPPVYDRRPSEVNTILDDVYTMLTDLSARSPEREFRPDFDFVCQSVNEVIGVGPRFVDLYGEPLEAATLTPLSVAEEEAQLGRASRLLGADVIIDNIGAYTVRLAK